MGVRTTVGVQKTRTQRDTGHTCRRDIPTPSPSTPSEIWTSLVAKWPLLGRNTPILGQNTPLFWAKMPPFGTQFGTKYTGFYTANPRVLLHLPG